MKRIAIDMDEVIADFASKHLGVYNRDFGESLTLQDVQGARLWHARPELANEILSYLDHPDFFRDLDVIEGSQDVVRLLSERYEIFITTAAMEHPASFTAKYQWLTEHFPFLSDRNFVFCGDKSIIYADYLIDDSSRHFARFSGTGILYTAPHNIHETGHIRVNNWEDIRQYFLGETLL